MAACEIFSTVGEGPAYGRRWPKIGFHYRCLVVRRKDKYKKELSVNSSLASVNRIQMVLCRVAEEGKNRGIENPEKKW